MKCEWLAEGAEPALLRRGSAGRRTGLRPLWTLDRRRCPYSRRERTIPLSPSTRASGLCPMNASVPSNVLARHDASFGEGRQPPSSRRGTANARGTRLFVLRRGARPPASTGDQASSSSSPGNRTGLPGFSCWTSNVPADREGTWSPSSRQPTYRLGGQPGGDQGEPRCHDSTHRKLLEDRTFRNRVPHPTPSVPKSPVGVAEGCRTRSPPGVPGQARAPRLPLIREARRR